MVIDHVVQLLCTLPKNPDSFFKFTVHHITFDFWKDVKMISPSNENETAEWWGFTELMMCLFFEQQFNGNFKKCDWTMADWWIRLVIVGTCLTLRCQTLRSDILVSDIIGHLYGSKNRDFLYPYQLFCMFSDLGEAHDKDVQVVELPIVDSLHPRPPYLPLAIPEDLAPRLQRLHGDPSVWWVSQFVKYLVRPQAWLEKEIQQTTAKLGFKHPIIG